MNFSAIFVDMDKRTEKTLNAVYEGLSSLLKSKDYRDIKVDEILSASHVSRGAFYSHFKGKDDVLSSLIDQMFDHVFAAHVGKERGHDYSAAPSDTKHFLTHIAFHFYEEKDVIKPILASSSRNIFKAHFVERSSSIMNDSIVNKELYKEGVPLKIQSLQLTDSFVSIICHWIEMDCIASPETIVNYFYILHK